jgi:DNA-binding NarL/FixJ family response regulator
MVRAKQDRSSPSSTGRSRRHILMIIDTADEELVVRLQRQYPGALFIPLEQHGALLRNGTAKAPRIAPTLTPRQDAILQLLKQGLSNKEIARTLAISPYTVRNHVSLLLRILGVATRREAATAAGEAPPPSRP